jgi:hypothetical protein
MLFPIGLASFSFFSTTLPHHYQESTAQKGTTISG